MNSTIKSNRLATEQRTSPTCWSSSWLAHNLAHFNQNIVSHRSLVSTLKLLWTYPSTKKQRTQLKLHKTIQNWRTYKPKKKNAEMKIKSKQNTLCEYKKKQQQQHNCIVLTSTRNCNGKSSPVQSLCVMLFKRRAAERINARPNDGMEKNHYSLVVIRTSELKLFTTFNFGGSYNVVYLREQKKNRFQNTNTQTCVRISHSVRCCIQTLWF